MYAKVMFKVILTIVGVLLASGLLFFLVMLYIAMSGKPQHVDKAIAESCLHSDVETIMSRVIKARTHDKSHWSTFADAQNAATKAGILILPERISLTGNVWIVPFTQWTSSKGTTEQTATLDCDTDSVNAL